MDLLELPNGDLRVNLGGADRGMTQKLPDVADIGSVFEHQRGTAMAEHMAGTGFAELGRIDMAAHQLGHPVRGEFQVFCVT